MIRQSQAIVLLVCAALVTACGSDRALGPDATSGAFVFLVEPTQASLATTGQKTSVQLTVEVIDLRGALFRGPYSITYSSSAPGIATVSEEGVVTAVAPGTATITTTVTSGGVSRAATIPVKVAEALFDPWRIAGVYELIGQVTSFNPLWGDPTDWGDLTGVQYAATLTISSPFDVSAGASGEVGTFILQTDGGTWTGPITHSVPLVSGLFVLSLGTNFGVVATYVAEPNGNGVAPVIEGRFGAGGHIGGTFVATLNQWP